MTESLPSDRKDFVRRIADWPDWLKLLLASFLSLYVELLLIRWTPSVLHIVAFFNNLVLISCFLGLGIGMARPTAVSTAVRNALLRLFLTVGVFLAVFILNPGISMPQSGDYAVNEFTGRGLPMSVVLVAVFAMLVWTSMPFGQLVAAYFDKLERLPAYSVNVAGSLLGVLAFSVVAWLQLPPLVWFTAGLILLWLLDPVRKHLPLVLLIFLALVAQHMRYTRANETLMWSPYYKVVASPIVPGEGLDKGFTAEVNDQFLLSGLDLSDQASLLKTLDPESARTMGHLRSYYNFPFRIHPAKRVLVIGAGAGNDVAAALRNGVEQVTAVEIDPCVIRLGTQHPERPYQSPRVRIVNNDARAFLNTDHEKYDLIVFGTLDAHGLLARVGNIRLDSFIYTNESFAAARDHLADGGLMVLSFGPFREDIQYRQLANVRSVFNQDPLYFLFANGHRSIVVGDLKQVKLTEEPGEWRQIGAAEIEQKFKEYPHAFILPTDDWPYLYIRERNIPREYLGVFAGIVVITLILLKLNFRGSYKIDGLFFFMGAAFLLIETKSINEMSLLVGSTWQVNSLVFAVILLMILLANWLVQKIPVSVPACFLLLFASLAASYFYPVRIWFGDSSFTAYALACAYLAVPIFLAAIIFASAFRRASLGSAALASNLLGAVLGGLTEYLSLAFGIRALSLLALAFYAAACAFWFLQNKRLLSPGSAGGSPASSS